MIAPAHQVGRVVVVPEAKVEADALVGSLEGRAKIRTSQRANDVGRVAVGRLTNSGS